MANSTLRPCSQETSPQGGFWEYVLTQCALSESSKETVSKKVIGNGVKNTDEWNDEDVEEVTNDTRLF